MSAQLDLEVRKGRIGASEIGAIAGFNKNKSAYEVFQQHQGVEPEEEDRFDLIRGQELEEPCGRLYSRVTGIPLVAGGQTTFVHPEHPWMIATPDFDAPVIPEECQKRWGELPRVIEAKSVNGQAAGEYGVAGSEQMPEVHVCQGSWLMAVTGREQCDLAALIAFFRWDFRIYHIPRDREFEEILIEIGRNFLNHYLIPGVAPQPISAKDRDRAARALYPHQNAPMRDASDEEKKLAKELRDVYGKLKQAKAWETESADLKSRLKLSIGGAEGIKGPGFKITWRNNKDSHPTDWKALATELGATPADIDRHTKTTKGARPFVPTFEEGETEA